MKRRLPSYARISEAQADRLSRPDSDWFTVKVRPSTNASQPATPRDTVKGILELQTKWLGLRNSSPVAAYEIRRTTPDNLRFQFALPTKRLERKLRTHLNNEQPRIEYAPGDDGIPVTHGDTVGGAILTPGRRYWYPLQTEFDEPPINRVAAALHRHAMQDTQFVIQILFQPAIGRPLRSWWRTRRTYQHVGFLRREKERLWGSRSPTPRERSQAKAIERKAGTPRFHTSIRILVIGAGEYTPSRVKEIAGGFNVFENLDSGQFLNAETVHSPFRSRILSYASTVTNRQFGNWHRRFQASIPELAALVSIPNRTQHNITTSKR